MEYKIISGTTAACQMKLNQWKHEFDLEILAMSANENITVILLIRKRKNS